MEVSFRLPAPVAFLAEPHILRRVKIAINHTRFARTGGIERYIFTLVERLLAAGHEVHCFVRRWEPHEHPRLRFHRVPVLPLGEGVKALTFAYASARLLERERFDVVHGFTKTFRQDLYTDGSGCFEDYLAYLRTAPPWRRVITYRPLLAFAIRHIERRRFRRAPLPRVLAMSRGTRDQILKRHAFPPELAEILHGGVDTAEFHPARRLEARDRLRRRYDTPDGALVLLVVGNDYRRKGVGCAIEAVARVGHRDLMLWVAGHDRKMARYEAIARRRGVAARFLGPQARPAECLATADAFLFPSRFDAFGNAALEALAAGLPAIVSSRAGVSELIRDGVNGLLLEDPEDPGELARRIGEILDPARREEIGTRARATAEEHTLERHFARLFEVYREITGARGAWKAPTTPGSPGQRSFFGQANDSARPSS